MRLRDRISEKKKRKERQSESERQRLFFDELNIFLSIYFFEYFFIVFTVYTGNKTNLIQVHNPQDLCLCF
jgi:hypothetical protein